mmetsp:Transcript_54015/g.174477  ORF Transcript_54015/g.174477 Transcript_54015/m.174477 type:complete len:177 (-) Transcript_54015:44-574(-)
MQRLPKVKNKNVATSQACARDLLLASHPSSTSPAGRLLLAAAAGAAADAAAAAGPLSEEQIAAIQREDRAALQAFHGERGEASEARRLQRLATGPPPSFAQKQQQQQQQPPRRQQRLQRPAALGARAVLRVRRGYDWVRRRLLHLAIAKESPATCPMARLPQGFAGTFVQAVFSFL